MTGHEINPHYFLIITYYGCFHKLYSLTASRHQLLQRLSIDENLDITHGGKL